MMRRSLMQIAGGAWRSFHGCANASIGAKSPSPQTLIAAVASITEKNAVLSSIPPLAPSPTPFSTLIKAPRISPPLIKDVRILPSAIKSEVELPYLRYKEVTLPNLGGIKAPLEEPKTTGNGMHCAVLVQIRRRKMKKHQRRKFRKRMRFYIQKVEMRRLKAKEAAFKEELLSQIDEANKFNAETFIKESLQKIRDRDAHIETREQRHERFMELKRKYRSNVKWIKPKLED